MGSLEDDPYTEGVTSRRLRTGLVMDMHEYEGVCGNRATLSILCELELSPSHVSSPFGPAVKAIWRDKEEFVVRDDTDRLLRGPLTDTFSHALVEAIQLLRVRDYAKVELEQTEGHGRFVWRLRFVGLSTLNIIKALADTHGNSLWDLRFKGMRDDFSYGRSSTVEACLAIRNAVATVIEAASIPDETTLLNVRHSTDILERRYELDNYMKEFCDTRSFGFLPDDLAAVQTTANLGGLARVIGGKPVSLLRHQKATVQKMRQLERDEMYRGGILAEEMGLGKTITMLALLCCAKYDQGGGVSEQPTGRPKLRPNDFRDTNHIKNFGWLEWDTETEPNFPEGYHLGKNVFFFAPKTTLYVTTAVLVQQVEEEAKAWTQLNVCVLDSSDLYCQSEAKHKALLSKLAFSDLVVTSYETLREACGGTVLPWTPDIEQLDMGDRVVALVNGTIMEGEVVSGFSRYEIGGHTGQSAGLIAATARGASSKYAQIRVAGKKLHYISDRHSIHFA
jgi:hypothetical protein